MLQHLTDLNSGDAHLQEWKVRQIERALYYFVPPHLLPRSRQEVWKRPVLPQLEYSSSARRLKLLQESQQASELADSARQ